MMIRNMTKSLQKENEKLRQTIDALKIQIAGLHDTIDGLRMSKKTLEETVKENADQNQKVITSLQDRNKILEEYYHLDETPSDEDIMKIRLNLKCYDLEKEVTDLKIQLIHAIGLANSMANLHQAVYNPTLTFFRP